MASLIGEHGLWGVQASGVVALGLWSAGSIVVVHGLSCSGVWDLPRSRIKAMSPALAGGFFTTEPPGKPLGKVFDYLANLLTGNSLFRYFCFLIILFPNLFYLVCNKCNFCNTCFIRYLIPNSFPIEKFGGFTQ